MFSKKLQLIVMLLMFFIGLFLAGSGLRELFLLSALRGRGAPGVAIVEKVSQYGQKGTMPRLKIAFNDHGRIFYSYRNGFSAAIKVGDSVSIAYDKESPGSFMLLEEVSNQNRIVAWNFMVLLGGVIIVASALWWRRWRGAWRKSPKAA